MDAAEAVLNIVSQKLSSCREEDEYDAIGKNVASKLRRLNPEQRIFTEKIISDVLYEAQLTTLNRTSRLLVNDVPLANSHLTHLTAFSYDNPEWPQRNAAGFIQQFNPNT